MKMEAPSLRRFHDLLRRHGAFLLLFCSFYAISLIQLIALSSWDLADDEFIIFEHARHLLRTGNFVPGMSIDSLVLVGAPRGFLFALMTAGSMALFGIGETASRLPALLAGALVTLATYWFVLRTTARRSAALLGVILLLFTPLFVRWHFACRFYTLILLLHVLAMLFLYEGIEGGERSGLRETQKEDGGAEGGLRGFINREGLKPGYLVLFAVVYALNLNQHPALLLLVPVVSVYGIIMLVVNLVQYRSGAVGRPKVKYVGLGAILPLCCAVAALALVWPNSVLVRSLPALKNVPAMFDQNFDVRFGQWNTGIWSVFFRWPLAFVLPALSGLGVVSYRMFAPKRYRNVGVFLGVTFLALLLSGAFAWRRYAPRYVLFMLAMHVPLVAMGIYAVGRAIARLRADGGKSVEKAGEPNATFTWGLVGVVVLVMPVLWSGRIPHRAFRNPFGFVEHEEGYDALYGNLRPGDYVLMSNRRRWYADRLMRRHNVSPTDYRLETFRWPPQLSSGRLAEQVRNHSRGWIMWSRRKNWYLSEEAIEFCRENLTPHHTQEGSVRIYSWGTDRSLPEGEQSGSGGRPTEGGDE